MIILSAKLQVGEIDEIPHQKNLLDIIVTTSY